MEILIAPDKFKGSLSAREVAENIVIGLRHILPEAKIDIAPMADGGEGTAEVICAALGGTWQRCQAHDPLGREIEARYAFVDPPSPRLRRDKLAIMEMSEAAGMRLLSEKERDPLRATTFGVGEMILQAHRHKAGDVIVGLGGSATNDGGFGMARALGFRFFADSRELAGNTSEIVELTRIQPPSPLATASSSVGEQSSQRSAQSRSRGGHRPRVSWESGSEAVREAPGEGKIDAISVSRVLSFPKIIGAADVRNPLLGKNGCTRVFGPQKGASPDKIDILEHALARLADVVAKEFGFDYREEPGAGAAGGLGFGLMSFCGAKIRPGFEVVAEAVGLESKMKDVDVVITGEGSLDRQTLEGKTPAGVARMARKLGKRVFAIVGRASEDRQVREIFDGVFELGGTIPEAPELLQRRGRDLAVTLK